MAKKRIDQTKRVIQAAMDLAGQKGWEAVTLEAVARKLKKPEAALKKDFPDKTAILLALIRQTDARMEKTLVVDREDSLHDRLFEALMLRLDSVRDYREGIAALLKALPADPCLTRVLAQELGNSIKKVLLLTDGNKSFLSEKIKVFGLLAIYASVLNTWSKDDSADSSKTMAMLDKRLHQAGAAARLLGLDGQTNDDT